jgi:hypothetical protein
MITTFTAMRTTSAKALIIGLLVLLTGCSAVRLSYDNGASLTMWWLDGFLDLSRSQKARGQAELKPWFDWHRATQLPDYAQQLAMLRSRAAGKVSGDEVCAFADLARDRMNTALDRAAAPAAVLLPTVTAAQWQFLERKFGERNAEWRKDALQPQREDRLAAAIERSEKRAEDLYGRLDSAQRQLLAAAAAASPFDPEAWLAERETRQHELVQTLRRLQQNAGGDLVRRTDGLRTALRHFMREGDGPYGVLQARWQAHTCEVSARLHNSTSAAQREHLRNKLGAWEEDARALVAAMPM